jgi:3-oxoacyl-[acyl-carrier protein] reductase
MPTAVITGASRGIGRAIAKRLAREYAIVAAARTEKDLKTLAAEIEQAGGSCRPVVVDVSDDQAVQRAFTQIQADVLVNNAGVGVMKPLLELTPADWRLMMSTNLDSLYYVTRALLPGMVARRSGFVITIGSLAGRNPFAGGTCYTATKHGVIGFAESLPPSCRDRSPRISFRPDARRTGC